MILKMSAIKEFVDGYIDCVQSNLGPRQEPETDRDWYSGESTSVIGALIARQATLSKHLAISPNCWNGHVAPLFLRSMIDAHISLAWILQKPTERSLEYISYALGQEKLSIGHLERKNETEPGDALEQMIEVKRDWVNSHSRFELVEVNLGSWSGSSVRQMCQDIDDEDFYNFSFTPFSACVHNTWAHIGMYNSWPCANPLHKGHMIGSEVDVGIDVDFLFRSAKYLRMSLDVFDRALGLNLEIERPDEWIQENEGMLYSAPADATD